MSTSDFITLIGSLRPLLTQHASALLTNREEVEDIVQDVLIRMWLLRERWTDETELRRMALASVRNAALNVLRGHRHTEAIDLRLAETGPADDRNPLRDMEHKETEQRIAALIHDLPERGRAYLQMRAEGLSYNEIAVISGTSEVNVRSRVSRVRTWLLEQMRMRRI